MQEVQDEKGESDLATIRAWRETKRVSYVRRTVKDHLTTPQYVMWEFLHLRERRAMPRKPSLENNDSLAMLIRGLQRLTGLAEVHRREFLRQSIAQAEVRAATVKALKLAEIAHDQAACASCIFNVSQTHLAAAGSGAV